MEPIAQLGDYCRYAPCADGYCEASICVPLKAEASPCEYDSECESGLVCVYEGLGETGTCRPAAGSGQPCPDQLAGCAQIGELCHASTGRCARGRFAGERCDDNSDCTSDRCDETNHCVDNALSGLGENCWSTTDCTQPLVCDRAPQAVTGVCIQPKADGEPCAYDEDCASHRCDGLGVCSSTACI